jgi:hypothetical protein
VSFHVHVAEKTQVVNVNVNVDAVNRQCTQTKIVVCHNKSYHAANEVLVIVKQASDGYPVVKALTADNKSPHC